MTLAGRMIAPSAPTRTCATPLLYPGEAAVTIVIPTTAPVTVKPAVVLPPPIVTVDGCRVTIPSGLDERLIVTPPGGAGALRTTAALIWRVTPTVGESRVIDSVGTETITVASPGLKPGAEPVIVALPTVPVGVTVTPAVVAPGAISTVGGTVAMLVSVLARLIT